MSYDVNVKTLYEGCYLASISCAVMSAKFPELSFEHSWDGASYSVQDGFGSRGTVTFQNDVCVCAIRSDNSERLSHFKIFDWLRKRPCNIYWMKGMEKFSQLLQLVSGITGMS